MKIAIIGTGNVGSTLAKAWASKGHEICLGVRNLNSGSVRELCSIDPNITARNVPAAAAISDVIVIAATPMATAEIADFLGDTTGKVIIDAMNSVRTKPEGFENSYDALKQLTKNFDIVKAFNSTGFENLENPIYDGEGIDMFMAGDSEKAKSIARVLAIDLGFKECYDFGGDDKVQLLEDLAFSWINLAIMQGNGRNMAFIIKKR